MALSYNLPQRRSGTFVAGTVALGEISMRGMGGDDRLRLDLATARRARAMITDPLSMRMLSDYISELEEELHRGDAAFLLAAVEHARAA